MKKIIIIIIAFISLFTVYGMYINTQGLSVKNYNIEMNFSDKFDGFKIVQFSDLLLGSTTNLDTLDNIVNKINEMDADIIIFTGDLIADYHKVDDVEKVQIKDKLTKLKCKLYKYAVYGDNDLENINLYKEIMNESNFNLLDNSYMYIFDKEINPIKLIGLTDTSDMQKVMQNEENINPLYNIFITHYPDNAKTISEYANTNLILAGHSLLGQVRLPFFGGIIKKDGAKIYLNDYYKVNDSLLYVTGGIGTEKISFRTFNQPSINVYTLNYVDNK